MAGLPLLDVCEYTSQISAGHHALLRLASQLLLLHYVQARKGEPSVNLQVKFQFTNANLRIIHAQGMES